MVQHQHAVMQFSGPSQFAHCPKPPLCVNLVQAWKTFKDGGSPSLTSATEFFSFQPLDQKCQFVEGRQVAFCVIHNRAENRRVIEC